MLCIFLYFCRHFSVVLQGHCCAFLNLGASKIHPGYTLVWEYLLRGTPGMITSQTRPTPRPPHHPPCNPLPPSCRTCGVFQWSRVTPPFRSDGSDGTPAVRHALLRVWHLLALPLPLPPPPSNLLHPHPANSGHVPPPLPLSPSPPCLTPAVTLSRVALETRGDLPPGRCRRTWMTM